jgi:hypothetical protein
VTVRRCTGGAELVVAVAAGAIVEGVVLCRGVHVADVPVRIVDERDGALLAATVTADNGAFWFPAVPATRSAFVQALSTQHAPKLRRLEVRAGARHSIELNLEAGGSVRGRVVDAVTGQPIAGAEVSDSWEFDRSVRTDADGRFARWRATTLYVRAPGYAAANADTKTGVCVVELAKGATVTGRIVGRLAADADLDPDSSVPAARVVLAASHGDRKAKVEGKVELPRSACDWIVADLAPDGRFVATGLRPDRRYWLMACSPGFASRMRALGSQPAAGETVDVGDVALCAEGSIEGRIVDDGGVAVAGLEVEVLGHGADAHAWLGSAEAPAAIERWTRRRLRTDASGRFWCGSLAAGEYEVVASPAAQQWKASASVAVRDGMCSSGIELVVGEGNVIEGAVTLPGGVAVGALSQTLRVRAWNKDTVAATARLRPDGRFRLTGLDAATYAVTLVDCPAGWAASPRTSVATGTKDVQLELTPVSFVNGSVVDAQGRACVALVTARAAGGGPPLQRATDAAGNFRIEVPSDFVGSLSARRPKAFGTVELERVTAGAIGVRLELPDPPAPPQPR